MRNEKGFSLVEMMVAVGLIGALAVGYMNLNSSSLKQQKSLRANLAANSIQLAVESVLAYGESCTKNFGPSPGANLVIATDKLTSVTPILDAAGGELYPVGDTAKFVEGGLIRIRSWDVKKKADLSVANKDVMLEVGLNIESSPTEGHVQSFRRILNVMARLDATGKVTMCHVAGSTVSKLSDVASSKTTKTVAGTKDVWCEVGETVKSCDGQGVILFKQGIVALGDFGMRETSYITTEITIFPRPTSKMVNVGGSGTQRVYGCEYPEDFQAIPNGSNVVPGSGITNPNQGGPTARHYGPIEMECVPEPSSSSPHGH